MQRFTRAPSGYGPARDSRYTDVQIPLTRDTESFGDDAKEWSKRNPTLTKAGQGFAWFIKWGFILSAFGMALSAVLKKAPAENPYATFELKALRYGAYYDFNNLVSSVQSSVYSTISSQSQSGIDVSVGGEYTHVHPLDETKVWNAIQATAFDPLALNDMCYPTTKPESGKSYSPSVSATYCNNEVYRGCAGNIDTLNLCFGDFMDTGDSLHEYSRVYTEGAFYTEINAMYKTLLSNPTMTPGALFERVSPYMKECWRVLYDAVTFLTPDSNVPSVPRTLKSRNGNVQVPTIAHYHERFAVVVQGMFAAEIAYNPGASHTVSVSPDLFMDSIAESKASVQTFYNTLFSPKNDKSWDAVTPYMTSVFGISCADIRTDYLNPRHENRVRTSVSKTLSDVKCVQGTFPAFVAYDATTGARSFTNNATLGTNVGCTSDSTTPFSSFTVNGFTFDSSASIGSIMPVTWASNSISPFKMIEINKGELRSGGASRKYPIFSTNEYNFVFQPAGITKNGVTTTTGIEYTFSTVSLNNGVYENTANQPYVSCNYTTTFCSVKISKNTLVAGDMWVKLTAKETASGLSSTNAEILAFTVLPFSSTVTYTAPSNVVSMSNSSVFAFDPLNHATSNIPYASYIKNMFKPYVPATPSTSASGVQWATALAPLQSILNLPSPYPLGFYACSKTATGATADCATMYEHKVGVNAFYMWIFDNFGNGVSFETKYNVTA